MSGSPIFHHSYETDELSTQRNEAAYNMLYIAFSIQNLQLLL
jgi:hypothetical protein